MKFKELNEANEEKLFVVKVTDLEYKGIEYVRTLNCSSAFPLTPLLKEALPVTKDEWERCALREKLAEKTFWKRLSWEVMKSLSTDVLLLSTFLTPRT